MANFVRAVFNRIFELKYLFSFFNYSGVKTNSSTFSIRERFLARGTAVARSYREFLLVKSIALLRSHCSWFCHFYGSH